MLSDGQLEGRKFELYPSLAFNIGSLFDWKGDITKMAVMEIGTVPVEVEVEGEKLVIEKPTFDAWFQAWMPGVALDAAAAAGQAALSHMGQRRLPARASWAGHQLSTCGPGYGRVRQSVLRSAGCTRPLSIPLVRGRGQRHWIVDDLPSARRAAARRVGRWKL